MLPAQIQAKSFIYTHTPTKRERERQDENTAREREMLRLLGRDNDLLNVLLVNLYVQETE